MLLTTGADVTTAASTTAPVSLAKPTGLVNGDFELLFLCQKNVGGSYTPPTGYSLLASYNGTPVRTNYVYGKDITNAAGEANPYSIAAVGGTSRYASCAVRATGMNNSSPVDATGAGVNVTATTATAPAVTAVATGTLLVSVWQINVSGLTPPVLTAPPGQTLVARVDSPDAGSVTTLAVYQETVAASGSTGTRLLTSSISGTINGYMFTMAIVPVSQTILPSGIATGEAIGTAVVSNVSGSTQTLSPSGIATAGAIGTAVVAKVPRPVDTWVGSLPLYVAHRGESSDYVEMSMDAYAHAAAWNPNLAMEVSVWRTSDGVWVNSHDQTTGRIFGTNIDIPSNTWASMSSLVSTVGGQPICRLTDVLDLYGSNRILFIDNKGDTNVTAFLDLLDSYAGATRYVVKGFNTQAATPAAARLRGYWTWGYYYDADVPNLGTTGPRWDLLGMDITGTTANWNTMHATGKLVLGHTPATAADKTLADSHAADGYVAASFIHVVPFVGSFPQTLSPSGIGSSGIVGTTSVSVGPAVVVPPIVGSYTYAQIVAQLQSSVRHWDFEYRVFDSTGLYRFSVSDVACNIINNDLAAIKRTATLTIKESDAARINMSTDRIQPVIKLTMPDGNLQVWPMGMFLMAAPTQTHAGLVIPPRSINAFDLGLILQDDKVVDRYTVTAGTAYVDAILVVLVSSNFNNAQIVPSASVLPADRDWDPGTTKAAIINDLLKALNYATLSFDGNGVPLAGPQPDTSTAPSLYTYNVGAQGVVIPDNGFAETLDLSGVPNVFVQFVSSPDTDGTGTPIALRSEYINSNPASPTSTVSLGRNIVDYESVTDIADQSTLDASTLSAAQQASQVFSVVEFYTGLMPIHTTADILNIDWGDGSVRYKETQWSMDLKAGAQMDHQVQRVVSV